MIPDILLITFTIVAQSVANWPNPKKDPLIFVANPVEANMPGHWVPLSIVKFILEGTTTSTPKPKSPLVLKKTLPPIKQPMKQKMKTTTKRTKPPRVKTYKPRPTEPYEESEEEIHETEEVPESESVEESSEHEESESESTNEEITKPQIVTEPTIEPTTKPTTEPEPEPKLEPTTETSTAPSTQAAYEPPDQNYDDVGNYFG